MVGESGATAWLYDTFAPVFRSRLQRRYSYVDPEDVLHDAFVQFFRDDCRVLREFGRRVAPAAQTRAALERYLWGLVCGLVSNHRRSASFRNSRPLLEVEMEDSAASGEAAVVAREQLRKLDACLRATGDRLYLYFKLRYSEGLSPEEIARVTGWSRKQTYKLKQAVDRAARRCAEKIGVLP